MSFAIKCTKIGAKSVKTFYYDLLIPHPIAAGSFIISTTFPSFPLPLWEGEEY